jgi:hypothetical protein
VFKQRWKSSLFTQFPDGPDWVLETDEAFRALDSWRQSSLTDKSTSIVVALTTNTSKVFGGFGRHLANDYLYLVAIPPGLTVSEVCKDEQMWNRLRSGIYSYMQMWHGKEFISRCVTVTNSLNPFHFNHTSNDNYLKMFTKVSETNE